MPAVADLPASRTGETGPQAKAPRQLPPLDVRTLADGKIALDQMGWAACSEPTELEEPIPAGINLSALTPGTAANISSLSTVTINWCAR
jgi:hypothetical protein